MAILVYFEKTAETTETVEYAFGGTPDELDRRLTIDKAAKDGRPADGLSNHQFLGALRKILVRQDSEGTWPTKGMRAS